MNKCAYKICLIKVNAINRIHDDISMQIANPNSKPLVFECFVCEKLIISIPYQIDEMNYG